MLLSPAQHQIFNETTAFLLDKLDQILEISKSIESKEAFFFILGIIITEKEISVSKIACLFYKDDKYQSMRDLFYTLSRLIQVSDTDSKYIKAVTDPRFFSNQPSGYEVDLKKEFAKQLKNMINSWMHEKAPSKFFEKKYPLLYLKYTDLIHSSDNHIDQMNY